MQFDHVDRKWDPQRVGLMEAKKLPKLIQPFADALLL